MKGTYYIIPLVCGGQIDKSIAIADKRLFRAGRHGKWEGGG